MICSQQCMPQTPPKTGIFVMVIFPLLWSIAEDAFFILNYGYYCRSPFLLLNIACQSNRNSRFFCMVTSSLQKPLQDYDNEKSLPRDVSSFKISLMVFWDSSSQKIKPQSIVEAEEIMSAKDTLFDTFAIWLLWQQRAASSYLFPAADF